MSEIINYWVLPAIADRRTINTGFASEVIRAAESRYGVKLTERTRKRDVCDARQVVCYILRYSTELSTTKIGELLNIDHATVIHGSAQAQMLLKHDKIYRQKHKPFVDEYMGKLSITNE